MGKISRRSMVGMITTGFVAFLFSPSAAGALNEPVIRAGDTCKKVGRRKTSGGKTFECVKTANGNTWRRAKASTPSQPTTSEVKVLDSNSLSAGASQTAIVTSGGKNYAVVLTRTSGGVVAFSRSCTHQGSFVSPTGANQLTCPSHGAVFNASTGAVIEGPATRALTQYKVSERSGAIYITI
jgi:nitrite reductase/ring-hydroxylating ferredoxin subunit